MRVSAPDVAAVAGYLRYRPGTVLSGRRVSVSYRKSNDHGEVTVKPGWMRWLVRGAPRATVARTTAMVDARSPAVALLPRGDRFEDFHDKIGISLENFREELTGTWLFKLLS